MTDDLFQQLISDYKGSTAPATVLDEDDGLELPEPTPLVQRRGIFDTRGQASDSLRRMTPEQIENLGLGLSPSGRMAEQDLRQQGLTEQDILRVRRDPASRDAVIRARQELIGIREERERLGPFTEKGILARQRQEQEAIEQEATTLRATEDEERDRRRQEWLVTDEARGMSRPEAEAEFLAQERFLAEQRYPSGTIRSVAEQDLPGLLTDFGRGVLRQYARFGQRAPMLAGTPEFMDEWLLFRPESERWTGTAGEITMGFGEYALAGATGTLPALIAANAAEHAQIMKESGADDATAVGTGIIYGLAEAGLFKATGAIGRGAKEEIGRQFVAGNIRGAATTLGRTVGTGAAAGSGIIELENLLTNTWQAMTGFQTPEEALENFIEQTPSALLGGALSGGVITGGSLVHATIRGRALRRQVKDAYERYQVVETDFKSGRIAEPEFRSRAARIMDEVKQVAEEIRFSTPLKERSARETERTAPESREIVRQDARPDAAEPVRAIQRPPQQETTSVEEVRDAEAKPQQDRTEEVPAQATADEVAAPKAAEAVGEREAAVVPPAAETAPQPQRPRASSNEARAMDMDEGRALQYVRGELNNDQLTRPERKARAEYRKNAPEWVAYREAVEATPEGIAKAQRLKEREAEAQREIEREERVNAQVDAAAEALRERGYTPEYTSDSGSVYFTIPGVGRVRISDHQIPLTGERIDRANRRGTESAYDEDIIFNGRGVRTKEEAIEKAVRLIDELLDGNVTTSAVAPQPASPLDRFTQAIQQRYGEKAEGAIDGLAAASVRKQAQQAGVRVQGRDNADLRDLLKRAVRGEPVNLEVENATYAELGAMLKERGLPTTGKAADRRARLYEAEQVQEVQRGEEEAVAAREDQPDRVRTTRTDVPEGEVSGRAEATERYQRFESESRVGRETVVRTKGPTFDAEYRVVDAEAITPSHDARRGFQQNVGGDRNERAYHVPSQSQESRETVQRITDKPDVDLILSDVTSPTDGPPIATREGIILGGNARAMGIQLAYHRGGQAAQAWRRAMQEAAEKFGVDVSGIENPIVVRVLKGDTGEPGALTRLLNEALTAAKTQEVDAVGRALKISEPTARIVSNYLSPIDNPTPPSLRDVLRDNDVSMRIVQRFVEDGAWTESDIERFVKNSRLNDDGKALIERMLLARIIDDVQVMASATPAVRQRLMAALPEIIRATEGEGGQVFRQAMFDSVASFGDWRNSGLSLQDFYVRQQSMTPPEGFGDPNVVSIVNAFDSLGPRQFKNAVRDYLERSGVGTGENTGALSFAEVEVAPNQAEAIRLAFMPESTAHTTQPSADAPGPAPAATTETGRGEGKQPWEMTEREHAKRVRDLPIEQVRIELIDALMTRDQMSRALAEQYLEGPEGRPATEADTRRLHTAVVPDAAVLAAYTRGETIPPEVLRDYPDLAERAAQQQPPADQPLSPVQQEAMRQTARREAFDSHNPNQIEEFYAGVPLSPEVLRRTRRPVRGLADIAGGIFDWTSQSMIGVVRRQGEAGRELTGQAERALRNIKRLRGQLENDRLAAARLAGRGRGAQALTNIAQNIDWKSLNTGADYGTADISMILEGGIPIEELPKRTQNWVRQIWKINSRIGIISENRNLLQVTPEARIPERVAELDTLPDSELADQYTKTFTGATIPKSFGTDTPNPKMNVEKWRQQIIERLARVRPFRRAEGGRIFNRIATEHLVDMYRRGENSPLWNHYVASIAELNGVEVQAVNNALKQFTGARFRHTHAEIPRLFPKHPTHLKVDDTVYPLLETHPYTYLNRVIQSFTSRMGVVSEFGQSITLVEGSETRLDQARAAAINGGVNQKDVDGLLDLLSGIPLDQPLATPGSTAYEALGGIRSIRSILQSSMLTNAWLPNLPEFLGNIRAYGGTRRTIAALADLAVHPAELNIALNRMGLTMGDIADLTINQDRWLRSIANVWGQGVLRIFPTRPIWSFQERHAAAVAYRLGNDLREGRAGRTDEITLRSLLGYSKEDAARLRRGQGTREEYIEVMQRFAARSNTTRLTHPIEESRAINSRYWQASMWFTRYPLMKVRTLGDVSRTWYDTATEYKAEPTKENAMMFWAASVKFADVLVGTTASGILATALRLWWAFGAAGLGILWREAEEDPAEVVFRSFVYAGAGPIFQGLLRAHDMNSPGSMLQAAVPVAGVFSETTEAIGSIIQAAGDSGVGYGIYKDQTPVQISLTWMRRHFAANRGVTTQMAILGLGSKDPELEAAFSELSRWRRRTGRAPGKGEAGDVDQEHVRFRRIMREATDILRRNDPDIDAKIREANEIIGQIVELDGKTDADIRRSIYGRRVLTQMKEQDREVFKEFAPDAYEKLNVYDQLLTQWAATFRGRSEGAQPSPLIR